MSNGGENQRTTMIARMVDLFPLFQAIGQAGKPCRWSVVILVLAAFVLVRPEETAEAITTVCERQNPVILGIWLLAVLGWALTSWYFARILTRFVYPDQQELTDPRARRLYKFLIVWLPRALGVAPLFVVAIALGRCVTRSSAVILPLVIVGIEAAALWTFVVRRRGLLRSVRRKWEGKGRGKLVESLWAQLEHQTPDRYAIAELPYVTKVVLVIHLVAFALLFLLFTLPTVQISQWLGTPTILVSAFAGWIVAGSVLAYVSSWVRLPLLVLLLGFAVVISRCNDDHVATLRGGAGFPERPSVRQDLGDWRMATLAGPDSPFIVVATEGGGIRAAYWTAAILSAIQRRDARFASRVYAISAVSGGSLGAAVFVALVRKGSGDPERDAAEILSVDSLAPPLAKMLYPDLVQRFLPFACPRFDRGVALESSWIRASEASIGENLLGMSFDTVWDSKSVLPRLFLNSTRVETGGRVVIAYPMLPPDGDTVDGDPLATFSVAQAVHASARFPYISPALTIRASGGQDWGHLVDGGYYENSGAATARDILDAAGNPTSARVIVIRYADEHANVPPATWATEATAPVLTLFNARDARGISARDALRLDPSRYVELRLHPSPPTVPPLPLGWMLSAAARTEVNAQVIEVMKSREVETILSWLSGRGP